ALFDGDFFDDNTAVLIPHNASHRDALWAFVSDESFSAEVRKVDQALKVTSSSFLAIPFDLKRWQNVALQRYPNGLPEPESDDPTQWLFHGRPEHSTSSFQVAVARLLGYRWPAEFDSEMRLSTRARDMVERCSELDEF